MHSGYANIAGYIAGIFPFGGMTGAGVGALVGYAFANSECYSEYRSSFDYTNTISNTLNCVVLPLIVGLYDPNSFFKGARSGALLSGMTYCIGKLGLIANDHIHEVYLAGVDQNSEVHY